MNRVLPQNPDLNTPVRYIKGIGERRAEVFSRYGINCVYDLLYYFPFDYFDLSEITPISSLNKFSETGKRISSVGVVRAIDIVGRPPARRCIIIIGDETGAMPLVFFQNIKYFESAFKVGETIAVSGKVNIYRNRPQIVHPRIDRLETGDENDLKGFLHTKGIIPKYPSGEEFRNVKITDTVFRKLMKNVVDQFAHMVEDHMPAGIRENNKLLKLPDAIRAIHFPATTDEKKFARYRLKFDEWFDYSLLLAIRSQQTKHRLPGISFTVESRLARNLVDSLKFKLTKAQVKVINEIAEDMKSPRPMNRLLQGDVGSGKTIVALIAMLIAIDNGYQVVLMAPTEILAEQHYKTICQLLNNIPLEVELLLGGQKKSVRSKISENILSGKTKIVIGTHALIQENVEFAKVGLVVIDEQHRFGVAQRAEILNKGKKSLQSVDNIDDSAIEPDVLVMTATPIPRTLSLTVYGDLDVSVIDEMPKDRKPIKTQMIPESQMQKVYRIIRESIEKGEQVFIIYPLIEESEKIDLKTATDSYEILKRDIFPDKNIGLIHGRFSSEEKDAIMEEFRKGKLSILVSTTVIEVGIDIPNATVMIIEHAERFGLAQLHQLRGRVGRGSKQSFCYLVVPDWLSKYLTNSNTKLNFTDEIDSDKQKAVTRIQSMIDTNDGFKIAEVDLKLRGPGDFFGTRQSGMPEFKIANVVEDLEIITIARKEAFDLIVKDSHLRVDENKKLRQHFFEKLKDSLSIFHVG